MKVVYCANCGTRLNIMRKALPKFGVIIDVVEYHKCPKETVPFDLKEVDIPAFAKSDGKNKFVEKLNELAPKSILATMGSDDLRDRRDVKDVKETEKSSAPDGLLGMIDNLQGSEPASDPGKEPKND